MIPHGDLVEGGQENIWVKEPAKVIIQSPLPPPTPKEEKKPDKPDIKKDNKTKNKNGQNGQH